MEERRGSSRADRKTVERNRRNHMKTLFSTLNSIVPNHSPREVTLLPDQLHNAANYIKALQENIEQLNEKKEYLTGINGVNESMNVGVTTGLQSTYVEVRDLGPVLTVVLISGLDAQNIFYQSIRILEEEGAEVVNASFSIVGDKIFHTINSEVLEPRIGFDAETVSEKLHKLAQENESSAP